MYLPDRYRNLIEDDEIDVNNEIEANDEIEITGKFEQL